MPNNTQEEIKKCRIIVVDDSEFSRASINEMLEDEENIEVIGEAAHAEDAVKIIAEKKPDIVILDVVMPDISGIDLAKTINKSLPNVSIIMISSLAQEHVVIESISAGANDFIQKPFSKEDLINSIDKISNMDDM